MIRILKPQLVDPTSQGWAMPLIRVWHTWWKVIWMVNGPHNRSNIKVYRILKFIAHCLPSRHHTLGCRPSELNVDLPGRHPAVSSVDIMAVTSTGSTETWSQTAGGSCRKSSVFGRHYGRDVDRVYYISALFWKSRFQLFPVFSCVPGRPRQGPDDRIHCLCTVPGKITETCISIILVRPVNRDKVRLTGYT